MAYYRTHNSTIIEMPIVSTAQVVFRGNRTESLRFNLLNAFLHVGALLGQRNGA